MIKPIRRFALSLPLFLVSCFSGSADPTVSPFGDVVSGYVLAWSDEFNGAALDTDKWSYRHDSKMWSTQQADNVDVQDGVLRIALKKESAGGKNYTAGGVISKQTFQYGYYESRFKVPPGAGWHTSFWAMIYDGVATKPPPTQEIDFCEQDSVNTHTYSAGMFAWGNGGWSMGRQYVQTPDLSADFHVWACEYTPEMVKFFFDGRLTHQVAPGKIHQGPQNIWLTCIASPYGHTERVDDDKLPATAEFDYVRFFRKADSSADPNGSPDGGE